MRYISVFLLLIFSAASIFAQLNTAEKAESNTISDCFPKAFIIVPSEKIDPFIIVEPSKKNDSGILIEILCSTESINNQKEENLSLLISPNKKP